MRHFKPNDDDFSMTCRLCWKSFRTPKEYLEHTKTSCTHKKCTYCGGKGCYFCFGRGYILK
jgi:5-methylcytosine-specific restriction endonuclease McrA